jgi:hypothetical protein
VGTWCSGITPAQHAGGPGFNPQCVHLHVECMPALATHAAGRGEILHPSAYPPIRPALCLHPHLPHPPLRGYLLMCYVRCDLGVVCWDSLAEWSKALAPGASPQGRGFEPHSCHYSHLLLCQQTCAARAPPHGSLPNMALAG